MVCFLLQKYSIFFNLQKNGEKIYPHKKTGAAVLGSVR